MRMSSLVGRQIKEAPKDAVTPSHILLIRGGYVRGVSAGVYSLLPLGRRVTRRIEAMLRTEMDAVEGQEVLMPVVLPRELWEESGRYTSVGSELLRFHDRNGKDMVLGMTHEEAVLHLARTEITSWRQLPVMLYQLQTKYRDEARPRAGLIRVREFTMKDAYSFHASSACLEAYYERVHDAYTRFFRRVGLRDVLSIASDSGMMGGKVAHEFMAVADCGEDTLLVSPDGTYRANREVAVSGLAFDAASPLPLTKVATPGRQSIEDVAEFLGIDAAQTGKAVFFRHADGGLVFAVIRGDFEVNEAKLRRVVQSPTLEPATPEDVRAVGAEPGYASPLGVSPDSCRIIFDLSAAHTNNLVVGANEPDAHFQNFCFARDLDTIADGVVVADISTVRAGDPCPLTGSPLEEKRGIEVGNIFQLGTKYSDAMSGMFLDDNGRQVPYVMGCYGIGVGRAMAAVVEQAHDDNGPIWPITIAPFEVHIVALSYNKEPVQVAANTLYDALRAAKVDVLLDDRDKKAGFLFADADLVGVPFRFVVSPRGVDAGTVELKARDGLVKEVLPIADAVARVQSLIADAYAALES